MRLQLERARTLCELVKRREVRKLEYVRNLKKIVQAMIKIELDSTPDERKRQQEEMESDSLDSEDSDEEDQFIFSAAASAMTRKAEAGSTESMEVGIESECVLFYNC